MNEHPAAPIVSIGEVLWDLLPTGPRLGGTTTNFAVLMARLGNRSALVSRIGGDEYGRAAREQLMDAVNDGSRGGFLDLSCLQQSNTLPTGTVSVTLDSSGRPCYQIDTPAAWDEIRFPPELGAIANHCEAVCFGTLAQRHPTSRESIRAFIEATSPKCVRVCDVNLRLPFCDAEILHWCLRHATILKVSDEELPAMALMLESEHALDAAPLAPLEQARHSHEAALQFAREMLSIAPQCRLVAITLGPQGSLLVEPHVWDRHFGVKVKVVDTIGAGDAFTAGLAHAFLRGAPLKQINAVGNLCGGYVASQAGATPELSSSVLVAIDEALA